MSEEKKELEQTETEDNQLLVVEDFSIMELEDRLELGDRCNRNCSCPAN